MSRPDYSFENFVDPGYTAFTTGIDGKTRDACISLRNPKEYEEVISKLLRIRQLFRS